MTFSTLHVNDLIIGQRIHGLDRVLVQLIATAELAAITAAPTEENPMLGDGRSMVIPQRQFHYLVAFQFNYLARYGLLEDIYVAEAAKVAVPPSVDHSIGRHGSRVVIPGLDPQRHLPIFMGLEWTRVELVGNFDILGACR